MSTLPQTQLRCTGCNRRLGHFANEVQAGLVNPRAEVPAMRPTPSASDLAIFPAGSTLELLAEDAARAFLEHFRWPHGPVCPHCGSLGAYRLNPKARSTAPVRTGVLKCKA